MQATTPSAPTPFSYAGSPAFTPAFSPSAPSPIPTTTTTTTTTRPTLQPSQSTQPNVAKHRTQSVVSSTRGVTTFDDPTLEARKAVALLSGPSGLLAKLQKEQAEIEHNRAAALDASLVPNSTTPAQLIQTSNHIMSILSSSSLGGFPLADFDPSATIQQRIETTGVQVQRLFRDRQRMKEGAEIAGSVISNM